jgi:transposase
MKAYPVEYRRRVIELRGQGWSSVRIAEALGVSRAWVDSIRRLHAAGQPLEPKSRANHRTSLAQRQGERIKARVAAHPGTTLADLKRDLGLDESIWAIWHALRALGLSLKKRRWSPGNAPDRTSPPAGPDGRSSGPASTPIASSS